MQVIPLFNDMKWATDETMVLTLIKFPRDLWLWAGAEGHLKDDRFARMYQDGFFVLVFSKYHRRHWKYRNVIINDMPY